MKHLFCAPTILALFTPLQDSSPTVWLATQTPWSHVLLPLYMPSIAALHHNWRIQILFLLPLGRLFQLSHSDPEIPKILNLESEGMLEIGAMHRWASGGAGARLFPSHEFPVGCVPSLQSYLDSVTIHCWITRLNSRSSCSPFRIFSIGFVWLELVQFYAAQSCNWNCHLSTKHGTNIY